MNFVHYIFKSVRPTYTPTRIVVQQFYQSEVNNEYVIRGNSAILKCSIPSFVADFVSVLSWNDEDGNIYTATGVDGSSSHSDNNFGLL